MNKPKKKVNKKHRVKRAKAKAKSYKPEKKEVKVETALQ